MAESSGGPAFRVNPMHGSALAAQWSVIPRLARAGVVVLLAGGVADTVAHLTGDPAVGQLTGFTPPQHFAHLVILLGMMLTITGVVADGVRLTRLSRTKNSKEGPYAHRYVR